MGRVLTSEELENVDKADSAIASLPSWEELDGGFDYWNEVFDRLEKILHHKTTDGKPLVHQYREPTDEDAKQRPEVEVEIFGEWNTRTLVRVRNRQSYFVTENEDGLIEFYDKCRIKVKD